MMTGSTILGGCAVLGQVAADGAANPAEVGSVLDFVIKGGPMMIPIGLCSLIALAVVVERAISLRRRRVMPPDFVAGLSKFLDDDRDREKAVEHCKSDGSPLAAIFAAGIRRLGESVEQVEKHIQEAGQREVIKLRKYLRVLAVIGSVAPLMGLLGTIFGMIKAFQTVAVSGEALGKTELLAKGIYEAMISTAGGLTLAIPVLVAYQWISSKIEGLVVEMDRLSIDFVEQYARNGAGTELWEGPRIAAPTGGVEEEPEPVEAAAKAT